METKHFYNIIIGFVLLFGCEGNISDQRLCGDPTCSEPVSYATTLLKYSSDDIRILSFPANAKVKVFSKSAGTRMDLWGIEINGRRGYAPKGFLRENRILKSKLDHLVLTETEDEYDTTEELQGSQETQVVDGTTFFVDQSASSADETKSLHASEKPSEPTVQGTTTEPSEVPTQAETVMPSLVESESPIHSTEIPNTSDPSLSTEVPSSPSESLSESKSDPISVDPTLDVENPPHSVSYLTDKPSFIDPSATHSRSDPTEPTLIQIEAPVQPVTTDHVGIPLKSAEHTLIEPKLPFPKDVPLNVLPPANVEAPEISHEDQEEDDEDDDDDDDYFEDEEDEGNAKGIYQYISSFLPGEGNAVKEEPIPEDGPNGDESSKQSDYQEEIVGKGAVAPADFAAVENDSVSNSDIYYVEPSSIPDNIDSSVVIDPFLQHSDTPVSTEIPAETIDSSVTTETSSTHSSSSVRTETSSAHTADSPDPDLVDTLENTGSLAAKESYSETMDPTDLVESSTETMNSDDWEIEPPEMEHQDSVPVPEYASSSKDPQTLSEIVGNEDPITNDTEEIPGNEEVPDNLALLKQPSTISSHENHDDLNEKVTEEISPSVFSLVSNYLSGLSYPFAKSESDVEEVGVSSGQTRQEEEVKDDKIGETCSRARAARNCDMAPSLPAEPAYDYPYEMDSTKGLFEETDSAKLYYLIITAATVLLFTLGHYFIEKLRQDAKYVAAINDLQKQLLVSTAEVACVRTELEGIQDNETVEGRDNVEAVELTEKLIESQNVCAELEDQVACLQSELETATETGLELNRMLSEYLATQQDSENDPLKSKVEDLQIQLNSQQGKILSMNELLIAKDSEIELLVEELTMARTEKNELDAIRQELADLVDQAEEREASLLQVKRDLVVRDKEISVAQECITQMSATTPGQEDLQVLQDILDVARVQADLQIVTEERDLLRSQFQEEVNTRKMLEDHRSVIQEQITMLQEACRAAQSEKTEAKTKLEVLSNYFKEKEDQHQKELVSREATCLRELSEQSGDEISSLREQISSYKTQNDALKREILDQERDFKDQIASLELKAHENWVTARQAERRSEELKQDAATLRNLLTIAEKQSIKQLGDRLPSPLHAAMPDCPPVAVMPPCLFPAPGSPHDRRPPPLGCMSSPPLLPPSRYHHGFRPLSAPKGSNHSSGHSSGSIEKYNNQV